MRRLYLETSLEETVEIDNAIARDNQLKSHYDELVALKKEIEGAQLEPSEFTVKNILHYAQGLQEHS
jgi:hypothetical protein